LDDEIRILEFWAHGMNILQALSEEKIASVPGLKQAIEAVSGLPDAIGWGDEEGLLSKQHPTDPDVNGR